MNTIYIYLNNIEYEGKGQLFAKVPAGIECNCFQCKKIIKTHQYGSYKYCLVCYKNWIKHKTPKLNSSINNDDFID